MRGWSVARILFVLKKNNNYGFKTQGLKKSSGLFNSTRFIVESLSARGIHAHIVEVNDNNDIDREICAFKPKIVVIEALWVVPEKFDELKKHHPLVNWYVHLHSHIPFLAMEGIAMEWLRKYVKNKINIIANSPDAYQALRAILPSQYLSYIPNVYISKPRKPKDHCKDVINISCFGAVRPLKNQLLQAIAAIEFAKEINRPLRFHINDTRVESMGDPVLKNLRQLFRDQPKAELVGHSWMEPDVFLDYLHKHIDIAMQVSLTETFNVVTADAVTAGVPVVVSKEIKWVSSWCKAEDDSIDDMVHKLKRVHGAELITRWNQHLLHNYSEDAQQAWYEFVLEHRPNCGQ